MRLDFSFLLKASWGKGAFVEDYLLLAAIVQNLKSRTVLEIGTSFGLGAVALASAGASVTTVDVNQARGKDNLKLLKDIVKRVTFIEGDSSAVLPHLAKEEERFDLVFIDGDHSYKQASIDWRNSQALTSTWVLHDTTQFTGLRRLVAEIRKAGKYDVFQFLSAPGHRVRPKLQREGFITGMTLVQNLDNLKILDSQVHRDDAGELLKRHTEKSRPGLKVLYGA